MDPIFYCDFFSFLFSLILFVLSSPRTLERSSKSVALALTLMGPQMGCALALARARNNFEKCCAHSQIIDKIHKIMEI